MIRGNGLVLVALVGLMGCNIAINRVTTSAGGGISGPQGNINSGDFTVVGARLAGQLGSSPAVDADVANVLMEDTDWDTTLTVVTDAPGGSTMALVQVPGGLGREDFGPGFQDSTTITPNGISRSVVVTGCSGPERGDWDFDGEATETETTIEPTPKNPVVLRMRFNARWKDPGSGQLLHQLQGHVDFVRTSDLAPQQALWAPVRESSAQAHRLQGTRAANLR